MDAPLPWDEWDAVVVRNDSADDLSGVGVFMARPEYGQIFCAAGTVGSKSIASMQRGDKVGGESASGEAV